MKEIKKKIMDHIAKAETDEAFDLSMEHFPKLSKELVVLKGNYVRLKKRNNAGALSQDKYNEGIAEVTFNLIELLTKSEESEEVETTPAKKSNPIRRLISYQMNFLKDVISDFSRSKLILGATLVFVLVVGITSILQMKNLMPNTWGRTILMVTLLAFFTLIISALGFLNVQIKQFKGSKSFLKFQEHSEPES